MSKIFEQKEEQLLENEVESSLPSIGTDIDSFPKVGSNMEWISKNTLLPEEEKQLRDDKLREEADSRDADLAEGWTPN